jgi:NAD-dependent deacetylase
MKIAILTGAGISKESGIPTFRDADGLWNQFNVAELASAEALKTNKETVLSFYNTRKEEVKKCEPNAAHLALTELQKYHEVCIITQNVDDLHERAGSKVLHMHGSLFWQKCTSCYHYTERHDDMLVNDLCEKCGNNTLRPHVIFFGEYPLFDGPIYTALDTCDLFVSIGTSGNVFPAAEFVDIVNKRGIDTIELNLEKSCGNFKVGIYGKATDIVPKWVETMIGEQK